MSQTLQNQILLAKSMNGIVQLSDGAGTVIENGEIVTNNLTTGAFSVNDIVLNGSLKINIYDDIPTPISTLVSFYCVGKTYLGGNSFCELAPTVNTSITNKLYVDSAISTSITGYAKLALANTWSLLQTFASGTSISGGNMTIPTTSTSSYLLPYGLETGSYRIGLNSLQNASSGAINNYAFGLNALQCTTPLSTLYTNKIKNNIAIGANAGYKLTSDIAGAWSSDSNILIGHNTGALTFYNSNRNVIIGNSAGRNNILQDCVIIGDAACSVGSSQLIKAVVIGSGTGKNFIGGSQTVVGCGCVPLSPSNGITVFGSNCGTNAINLNGTVMVGNDCGTNQNSAWGCVHLGSYAGVNFVGNTNNSGYCCFLGGYADTTNQNIFNSCSIGFTALATTDFEFVCGGLNDNASGKKGYPRVTIPTKNRIYCNQSFNTASVTLAFRTEENVLLGSGVTAITLPMPTGNVWDNQGCTFLLIKNFTGTSTVTVNAPASQFIIVNGASVSSFSMGTGITYAKFICVNTSGSSWQLVSQDDTGSFANVAYLNAIQTFTAQQTINTLITNSGMKINRDVNTTISIIDDASNNIMRFTTSNRSFAFGQNALSIESIATAQNNVALGYSALQSLTVAKFCVAIGGNALLLYNNTTNTTHGMVAIGGSSSSSATTAVQNTTVGHSSGFNITTGSFNTCLGYQSGFASTTNQYVNSTCIGYLSRITADYQVTLGTVSETVNVPSGKIQYINYQPNSSYLTISANTDWNTSPPAFFSGYVAFSATLSTSVILTLPLASTMPEGASFTFRRTNATASSTSTSTLSVQVSGSDSIFARNSFATQTTAAVVLASGEFYGKITVLNKAGGQWCYFPC